jgi:hypothetical protein
MTIDGSGGWDDDSVGASARSRCILSLSSVARLLPVNPSMGDGAAACTGPVGVFRPVSISSFGGLGSDFAKGELLPSSALRAAARALYSVDRFPSASGDCSRDARFAA